MYALRRLLLIGNAICIALAGTAMSSVFDIAHAQAIWFSPVADQTTPSGFLIDEDYQHLFDANVQWPLALTQTNVFEIYRRYIETQPEGTLKRIFDFLKVHHVDLAIVFGVTPAMKCGVGVEGMAHREDENILVSRRLKRVGGELKYIVLDEPLHYGHYFTGRGACRYSIRDLATGASREILKIKTIFPDARVVDIEPSSGLGSPEDLAEWLDDLKSGLGMSEPRSLRFDVQWATPWQRHVPPLLNVLRTKNVGYGVYFNGSPNDASDEAWVSTAQSHARAWESHIVARPDHVVFGGWNPFPRSVLPEDGPKTITYLINWYCRQRPLPAACRSKTP